MKKAITPFGMSAGEKKMCDELFKTRYNAKSKPATAVKTISNKEKA